MIPGARNVRYNPRVLFLPRRVPPRHKEVYFGNSFGNREKDCAFDC